MAIVWHDGSRNALAVSLAKIGMADERGGRHDDYANGWNGRREEGKEERNVVDVVKALSRALDSPTLKLQP